MRLSLLPTCHQAVVRWALRNYLGITDRDPEPLPFDEARAREVAGRYENEVMTFTTGIAGAGQQTGLRMEVRIAGDPGGGGQGSRRRTRRRSRSACSPATSTSSPAASTRASAASSPATRAARSPASTWPGGWPAGS